MAVKTISSLYANGYTLAAKFAGLSITRSGAVESVDGLIGSPGHAGVGAGVALDMPTGGTLTNLGQVLAGSGGDGGYDGSYYAIGGVGGAGGAGAVSRGTTSISNFGPIAGGAGGAGAQGGPARNIYEGGYDRTGGAKVDNYQLGSGAYGGNGGKGGAGISLYGAGSITNHDAVTGGAGGKGGYGGDGGSVTGPDELMPLPGGPGGQGGAGGAGILLAGGGSIANYAVIAGGRAGDGGYGYFGREAGGQGGAGVVLGVSGKLVNQGGIFGGAGGVGGLSPIDVGPGYEGGAGGAGVVLGAGGAVTNLDLIMGGYGGAGSPDGAQGAGVAFSGAGTLTNGALGDGTALIEGGVGVYVKGAGTVTNFAVIRAADAADGDSVVFASPGGRLIAEYGAVFVGAIAGGGGTLELAGGKGTISGLGASGTLSGAVSATFSGFSAYAIDAGAVWTLAGSGVLAVGQTLTIAGALADTGALSGAGLVTGPGSLTIAAGGAIDADTAGGLVLKMAGGAITNDGLLEATGAGLLLIENTTVNNAVGSVVASGVRVDLEGADIVGGAVSSTGAGAIAVVGGTVATLDGTGSHPVALTGKVVVEDAASLTIEGAVVNAATIFVEGASHVTELVIGPGGATLSGGGSINLGTTGQSHIFATQPGATTLDNADNTISGAGTISDANLTLVNAAAGVIDGNAGQSLVLSTGANTIANAGVIEARGSGGVVVRSALANAGLIYAEGGNLTVNGAVTGTGTARVKGATLDFTSAFTQNVTFTGPTGVLELADSRAYTGTISGFSTGGGTSLDLGDIGFVSTGEATFSGTATSGVLTVTDGTHTAHITLEGDYLASTFTAAGDGHGGTMVTASAAPAHRFIAAAASLGGSAAMSVHSDVARVTQAPMLSRPHVMSA